MSNTKQHDQKSGRIHGTAWNVSQAKKTRWLAAVVLSFVITTGCWNVEDGTYECVDDSDCIEGFVCDGECVPADEFDDPTTLDAGNLDVDDDGDTETGPPDDADVDDGDDVHDAEDEQPPEVETLGASDIGMDHATLHGEIESVASATVTDHGFCIGTSPDPDECESLGELGGPGEFEMQFGEMTPYATYYANAYVVSEFGTEYGGTKTFGFEWSEVSMELGMGCALSEEGLLWCWADGWGDEPQRLGDAIQWQTISVGNGHGCGIQPDDTLWCWGDNDSGQLGLGDTEERMSPYHVGSDEWKSVDCGHWFTCGVRHDGSLWCWGKNDSGQLGLGDETQREIPTQVGTDEDWLTVTTGYDHACAIRTDGSSWCWGENQMGKLGVGDEEERLTPTEVVADVDWDVVRAGHNHSCGLDVQGSIWCWGSNGNGEAGVGQDEGITLETPERIEPDQVWEEVEAAGQLTCATRNDDSLWCWGGNVNGALGLGESHSDLMRKEFPEQVGTDEDWSSVAGGLNAMCATKNDGTLWCWGRNESGTLGLGSDSTDYKSPQQVAPE